MYNGDYFETLKPSLLLRFIHCTRITFPILVARDAHFSISYYNRISSKCNRKDNTEKKNVKNETLMICSIHTYILQFLYTSKVINKLRVN